VPTIQEWLGSPDMPNVPDPLQELRDVHMPDPISLWPPAIGWWMIMGLLIIGVSLFLWARASRERNRPQRIALAQLEHVKQQYAVHANDQWAIIQVSHLLRRYALAVFSRSQVAGLSGQSWLDFLDHSGGTNQFSDGPGQSLRSGPYQSHGPRSASNLLPLVERWIRQVQVPARKSGV
jgi:hypothetical protein